MKKVKCLSAAILGLVAALVFAVGCSGLMQPASRTMTFETFGGTSIDPIEAVGGETITPPADPEKEGFVFDGWYLDADCTGERQEIPDVMPDKDTEYYAKWLDWNDAHSLSFDANAPDGTAASGEMAAVYTWDETVVPDSEFHVDGYRFAGWATSPDGNADLTQGDYMVGKTVAVPEDITLYAVWAKGYYDINGSTDVVYITGHVIGFGSAALCREGQPDKLGFADANADGEIVGFTFMFDEGDVEGRLIENESSFVYRDNTVGMYAGYDYITGEPIPTVLNLDGYGKGTVVSIVGSEIRTDYYGEYTYDEEYNDYTFIALDPATQGPIIEGDQVVGFHFALEITDIGQENFNGYFSVQGGESGSYIKYENGYMDTIRLDLNGYGGARIYSFDPDSEAVTLLAQGTYHGTDDYIDEFGEYEFTPEDGAPFKFVLNYVMYDLETYIPVYIEFNSDYAGTINEADGTGVITLDGYGGMTYSGPAGSFEGLASFGQTLITFHIYSDEGATDVMYFNVDWTERTFTMSTDGYVVDNGVLVAYTGTSKVITIPDGVVEIADEVFSGMGVTNVTIPASVKKIGIRAFQNDYKLVRVTFLGESPDIDIDWSAANSPFRWPAGEFVIVVPEEHKAEFVAAWTGAAERGYKIKGSVEVDLLPEFLVDASGVLIAYNRPAGSETTDITISVGQTEYNGEDVAITGVADGVFNSSTWLTSVTFGSSVTSIGSNAFYGCTALEKITFNATGITVGEAAFAMCTALGSENGELDLAGVTVVGAGAFQGCTSVHKIFAGSGLESVGSMAFGEIRVEYSEDEAENILWFVIPDGDTKPALESAAAAIGSRDPFSGNIAIRIIIPNLDYALNFVYTESGWSTLCKRGLYLESGDEAGTYYGTAGTLVLEGRAIILSSESCLYKIDGTSITFYSPDAESDDFIAYTGTYEDGTITVEIGGQQYVFSKVADGAVVFTSTDGLYTLIVDDIKELNPETWSGSDYINHSITVTFNGTETTLVMRGNNDKTINDFLDSDGKYYQFKLTLDPSNRTFTYEKKQVVGSKDLVFDPTTNKIEGFTASDGSVINLHKLGATIYVYGELMDIDGIKMPAFSDYGTTLTSLEGNVGKFIKTWLSDKYEITFIFNQDDMTFTYTWEKQ